MEIYSKEFERFCEQEGYAGDIFKANLWKVWQASRESLVIELPTVCASDDPFVLKRDIIDEIHAAGVKTK